MFRDQDYVVKDDQVLIVDFAEFLGSLDGDRTDKDRLPLFMGLKDDQVLIVDEFTGRIMPGRRYSDGLHQAIEAKEHVKVKRESKTLATITFQNFFNPAQSP